MRCKAMLTREDVLKFASDFYEIESCRGALVTIKPDSDPKKGLFHVSIETVEPKNVWDPFLQASFKDGMLSHWKWTKKFTKQ